MRGDDSKLSMLLMLAAVVCCGLPLLFLVGGGSVFAIGISSLTNNIFLLVLGLILALVFVWMFLKKKRKNYE